MRTHDPGMARYLLAAVWLLAAGCGGDACLPEPSSDATPPALRVSITRVDPHTGRTLVQEVTDNDAPLTVEADPAAPVEIRYAATDPEGLRRLHLGLTVQRTVAVGVRQRSIDVEPVESRCPRADLADAWTVRGRQPGETLAVGLVAESWTGALASLPNVVVHYRAPAGP